MNSTQAVLLSYNHPNLTKMTLDSLLLTFQSENLLLVHNGSKKEIIDELTQNYPNITHVVCEENRGYSGGTNLGLQMAFKKSEWVFFFTNDTACLKIPENLPEPGFYAPKIFRSDQIRIDSMGGFFNVKLKQLSHAKSKEEFNSVCHHFLTSTEKWIIPYIPGTAFLIHQSVPEKIGYFDESLHTYWEDVDFSVRAQINGGFELKLCEDFEVSHKGGRTCKKDPFYTNFLFKRNRETISERYLNLSLDSKPAH